MRSADDFPILVNTPCYFSFGSLDKPPDYYTNPASMYAYQADGYERHLRLVQDNLRDTGTLLASGGIAMAEHVAKAIICGVDGVIIDLPILLALKCRLCRQCQNDGPCPVQMDKLNVGRGAQRPVNLMGAWNNQLLEVLEEQT